MPKKYCLVVLREPNIDTGLDQYTSHLSKIIVIDVHQTLPCEHSYYSKYKGCTLSNIKKKLR